MAIPIPGVGAAIGYGFGIAANMVLNHRTKDKYRRENKNSFMDKLKSWFINRRYFHVKKIYNT
ncbi:hypothetical protein GWJ21_16630 [Bacillus coagulans]|uniref:hypothetical protein n=1 Tax=Heyndrickxia coagulans TaxID=1398 RepID=UPI0013784A52|nr:hypothetical protein [Heyndrickxia coagulans]NCG69412.1 hypothetical protein [Heyndrickxia coagulans]